MEAVIFDGKEYVKAAVLAERFKYTQDYLGQLCRAKKVDARLVGRAWYINLDSLNSHKKTRYKINEKESETITPSHHQPSQNYLSRIDVEPVLKKKTVNILRNEAGKLTEFPVKYEKDDYSLIPRISHEAVLKNVRVLPAEAEDISIKSEKESSRITTFKAEPLPEVYLKGILRIHGLEEATEEDSLKTKHINQSEDLHKAVEIKTESLPETKDFKKIVPNETKKPIKIKLYRNVPTADTRRVDIGSRSQTIAVSEKKSFEKTPVFNKTPRTLQNRTLPVREAIEKSVTHQSARVSEIQVVPHATLKTFTIFLCSLLFTFSILLLEQDLSVQGGLVLKEWNISLDTLQSAVTFLTSK
jgi:hypothetical protein